MERKKEKLLRKIHMKDYTNSLEKILEDKQFSVDTKNLLLSMVYKIENSYKDYEKTKVQVCDKGEFLDKIIDIIKNDCSEITVTNDEIDENEKYEIQKAQGKIVALGNELTLLKSILAIGEEKVSLTEEESILEESISYFLNSASLMSQAEVIRDFNGWSWDISAKDIENNVINIMFQVLVYLLEYDFINSWANNTSQLADYLMLTHENLKENFGEQRAKEIVKILCKIAIEEKSKQSEEELEKWKKVKEETKLEFERLDNKAKYLEDITEEKKKITRKIEKIDKLLNNQELLREEYDERNSKLQNKDKIFSVRQLANRLEIERQDHVNEIKKYNDLLDPKGYVKRKDEITRKFEFLNSLELESNSKQLKTVCELCTLFLECFKIKIMKLAIRQDAIKYIYELRYFRFLKYDENTSLKDIAELNEVFEETIGVLYEKARALNAIEDVTKDEAVNYEIISKIFDSKMIDLNNMVIETKVEDGKLFIEYYDTNILENKIELHSDKTIKLNKKTKLFV